MLVESGKLQIALGTSNGPVRVLEGIGTFPFLSRVGMKLRSSNAVSETTPQTVNVSPAPHNILLPGMSLPLQDPLPTSESYITLTAEERAERDRKQSLESRYYDARCKAMTDYVRTGGAPAARRLTEAEVQGKPNADRFKHTLVLTHLVFPPEKFRNTNF